VGPLVIDGDYPMAGGAFDLGRDLTRPLAEVRAAAPDTGNVAMASLPEMRRGGVAAALVKVVGRIRRPGNPLPRGHLAYYRILAARGEARLLTRGGDLTSHLEEWEGATDRARLPVGLILGMEGADPILWPEQVHDWWAEGLRVVSLTHYGVSTYAHGTGTPGGLLPPAGALLRAMEAIGMILDVSHLADESFWGALDAYGGPVLASHQNCRALVAGERQFGDEQLRAVIARDGVIGVAMDTWMLYPDGKPDWRDVGSLDRRRFFPRAAVTLEHVADHIDHICQLAGNARHAAIGGDTDGQGGVDGTPATRW
jgi:membrane dipeptidase